MVLPIVMLISLSVFFLAAALWLFLARRQASPKSELKRRIQRMVKERGDVAQGPPSPLGRELSRAKEAFTRLPATKKLDKRLDHAGMELRAPAFAALTVATTLAAALTAWGVSGLPLAGVAAAALIPFFSLLLLRVKAQRRIARFTEQFPDALSIISRSLRAGHSFTTAVQLVGQEIQAPTGALFRAACDQQQLGLRLTEALAGMNRKMDSLDLRFFTTAVAINGDIGGNLSEVLDKLAATIRDRLRIRRQVQVYTAQGRMSGYILGALPLVAFIMFGVMNPQYESALLREPVGRYALLGAALLQLAGVLTIRRIIRIRI